MNNQCTYQSIYLSGSFYLSVCQSVYPSIYPTPLIYVVQAPGGDSRDRGLRLPGLQCAQGTRDRVYHVESMTIIIRSEEKLYSRLAKLLPHVRNLCHVSHNCTFNITQLYTYIHIMSYNYSQIVTMGHNSDTGGIIVACESQL